MIRKFVVFLGVFVFFTGCGGQTSTSQENTKDINKIEENNSNKDEPVITPEEVEKTDALEDEVEHNKEGVTNEPVQPSVTKAGEAETNQLNTISGYVLTSDDNNLYLDTQNPGGRTYPEEGKDRAIHFDISDAQREITDNPDAEARPYLRSALTVQVTYYVENGKNIATHISSDGVENQLEIMIEIIKAYTIKVDGNDMYVDTENIGERLYPGEGEDRAVHFDLSEAIIELPEGVVKKGLTVTINYYYHKEKNINIVTYIKKAE